MLDADAVFVVVARSRSVKPVRRRCLVVEVDRGVRTQRAEFGLRAGVNAQLEAGAVVVGLRRQTLLMRLEEVAATDVDADITADLQAGFGAGHVEEARAVDVADANVFDGLRLGDDDRVGRTSAGYCDQGRSGAEKKALDVHFLTSSQKLKIGSGFLFAEGQRSLPHPQTEKDTIARPFLIDDYPSLRPFNNDRNEWPFVGVSPKAVAQMTRFGHWLKRIINQDIAGTPRLVVVAES